MQNLAARAGAVACVVAAGWWSYLQVRSAVYLGPGVAVLTLVPVTALAYADNLWGPSRAGRRLLWAAAVAVAGTTVLVGCLWSVPYRDW